MEHSAKTPESKRGLEKHRLKRIKLFIMDVDGVLTDGRIIRTSDGRETKAFDVTDGTGITLAHLAGIATAIISGRESQVTSLYAKELGIREVYQVSRGKEEALDRLAKEHGLDLEQIAYVGDDVLDIPLLSKVGWAVGVASAHPEVKKVCHYVTEKGGGRGAVREAIELIIGSQGKWKKVLDRFLREQRKDARGALAKGE